MGLEFAAVEVRALQENGSEKPKRWTKVSMEMIDAALGRFQSATAADDLNLADGYISVINDANRREDYGGDFDAEHADYVLQVAVNGKVLYS